MAQLRCKDYTVGWIAALPLELSAAEAMLDEEHDVPLDLERDIDLYSFGQIAEHNVVMGCLPASGYGTTNAASVGISMLHAFRSLRIKLMVGIGGGVPSKKYDIRLGDVVVSYDVLPHDMGKTMADGVFSRQDYPSSRHWKC